MLCLSHVYANCFLYSIYPKELIKLQLSRLSFSVFVYMSNVFYALYIYGISVCWFGKWWKVRHTFTHSKVNTNTQSRPSFSRAPSKYCETKHTLAYKIYKIQFHSDVYMCLFKILLFILLLFRDHCNVYNKKMSMSKNKSFFFIYRKSIPCLYKWHILLMLATTLSAEYKSSIKAI